MVKTPKNQSRGQKPSPYAYCKGGPLFPGTLQSVVFCNQETSITVSGFHNVMARRVGIFGNGTALHNLQFSLSL